MKRTLFTVLVLTTLLPCVFAGGGREQGTTASSSRLIVIITNHETASFRGLPIQTAAFDGGY
jgi:hypothetical protein